MSLQRRAPMKRGQPLRSDRGKTQAWQQRSRQPLPKVGRKGKREQAAVDAFRAEVKRRAGGWCQAMSPNCPPYRHQGTQAHHVWPSDRDRGVHDPDRGRYVCTAGHDWIHDHPTEAEERGLLGRSL